MNSHNLGGITNDITPHEMVRNECQSQSTKARSRKATSDDGESRPVSESSMGRTQDGSDDACRDSLPSKHQ